ncbi:gastrula zinc finger protein XlCGF8.2DB-like [Entelurus aequoreus]|uniref:gastrula zinc finger protein XlCGF8.2DB-like n=1 Tax=Entelurus aequoreus TaxID=161455 RepID=UPI002B1E78AE|nr:gastrula zinc finger protein XlCGF8.2DB-like [Entelurus aequoreus]
MMKELVKERLMAAADDIFALFERTIASYEEDISRAREEKERHKPHIGDVQQMIGGQEQLPAQPQRGSATLKREDPQHPRIKEEEEELGIPQEADIVKSPLAGVFVRTEHCPSEDNKGAEPPRYRSPQHMPLPANGDNCGGSEADDLLAPLSDSEDAPEDGDWHDVHKPLSADCERDARTHTGDKHSECSQKKTTRKGFTCSVCHKLFTKNFHLNEHMRTHTGEKPFCCPICGKSFSLKNNRNVHLLTHRTEKPFRCSVCGKTFSRKVNMESHMITHTGGKPFECSVCDKSFSYNTNLITHMRTHKTEKSFRCSVCGRGFRQRVNMVLHMRTHTGEKPYSCPLCGKICSLKANLNRHMKTHTGEKPHFCSLCAKTFARRHTLTAHMLTHSRK